MRSLAAALAPVGYAVVTFAFVLVVYYGVKSFTALVRALRR